MSAQMTGRFAPTPSGRLHLGNILCCLLAYLSARSKGGRFLLRIEDVDIPRCPKRLADQCIEDLAWLGFTWDEPPLFQSQRGEIYQKYFDQLTDMGLYGLQVVHAEGYPQAILPDRAFPMGGEVETVHADPRLGHLLVQGLDHRAELAAAEAMADDEDPVLPVPAVVTVDIIASTAGQDLFFHGQVLPFLVGSIFAQGDGAVKENVYKIPLFR